MLESLMKFEHTPPTSATGEDRIQAVAAVHIVHGLMRPDGKVPAFTETCGEYGGPEIGAW